MLGIGGLRGRLLLCLRGRMGRDCDGLGGGGIVGLLGGVGGDGC